MERFQADGVDETCLTSSSLIDALLVFLLRSRSPPHSPDSVLKLKLCPPLLFFPNSSSQSDRSSFDKGSRGEYHDQRKQLLANSSPPPHYTLFESHLGSQAPSPSALESISRGPDGRFIIQPLLERSSPSNRKHLKKDVLQSNGGASGSGSNRTSFRESPKSSILSSEKDERKDSPLTVDVPELSRPPSSPGRVRAMARNFSRHGCFYSDDEQGSEALLERASFYSDNSEIKPADHLRRHRAQAHTDDLLTGLGQRSKLVDRDVGVDGQLRALANGDGDRVRDDMSKCVRLAKERAEMERELEGLTGNLRAPGHGRDKRQTESPQRSVPSPEEEPVWKPQDVSIRQKHRPQTSRPSDYRRACYFGSASSPMERLPPSHIQWDISPVTSVSSLLPAQSPWETPRPRAPADDSLTVDSSQSAVTQNTSLPVPSSPEDASPVRRRSLSPHAEDGGPGAGASWGPACRRSPAQPSPSGSSTLPYEQQVLRSKVKLREAPSCDEHRSSEVEREGVRARSRRSDRCVFSDTPSPMSSLTLVEEVDGDRSQVSVPRMSLSAAAPPHASPLQTSAILEYLSLPGFIEMSVDEPVDEEDVADPRGQSSDTSLVAAPDVVPQNWEVHIQQGQRVCPPESVECEASNASVRHLPHGAGRESSLRVRFPDETRPESPAPQKTCKQLYSEKTQMRASSTDRPESRLGSGSALFRTARDVADIVSKHSQRVESDAAQRQTRSQGSRTNNIALRICQAPVPFLKKSFSVGPCPALSGVGPWPYLKKSISLGSQRWEHFESPCTYVSEKCYWDEFPPPDVRVKAYSLGRTPPPFSRPGPSWREYVPFRRPRAGSFEHPHLPPRSLASPSFLPPSAYRHASIPPVFEPSDPRRQATVFLESSRWSPSFHDGPHPAPYKYVPLSSSSLVPQYQRWPGPRVDGVRRTSPRSFLPRGISWPSPCYAPFPPREADAYRQAERMTGRGGETDTREVREGGRTSYASQSSGRGSAGLFRQSLSVTPTLLSSPETTEESERHQAELELRDRRANR